MISLLQRIQIVESCDHIVSEMEKIAAQRFCRHTEYFCDTCVLNGAVGGLGAVCTPVLFGWQLIFFMTLFKERKKESH